MSVSGVSRLRSGDRRASFPVVERILDTYGEEWGLTRRLDGYKALAAGGEDQVNFLASIWG
jgi:hypothetical protein